MFSVLGFAFIIRGKLGQNIGFKIFLCIVIGMSAALLYQLTLSTQKLQSNLTGTKVEYMETDPNLNISISICNFMWKWPVDNITELKDFDSIFQRTKGDTEWIDYTATMSDIFIWKKEDSVGYLCKSIKFTEEEVKIGHSLSGGEAVILHDPGFISGGTSLMITGQELNANNILLLNAKQILNIEEENVCSNWIVYDLCREDYVLQEFNKTFGCIYFNMK